MNKKLESILNFFKFYNVDTFNGDVSAYTSCNKIMLTKYLVSGKTKNISILLKDGVPSDKILRLNSITSESIGDYLRSGGICLSFENGKTTLTPSIIVDNAKLDIKEWVYPNILFYGLKYYSNEYYLRNIDLYTLGPEAKITFSDNIRLIQKPTLKEIYDLERRDTIEGII